MSDGITRKVWRGSHGDTHVLQMDDYSKEEDENMDYHDITGKVELLTALLEKDTEIERIIQTEFAKIKKDIFRELLGMKTLVLTELAAIKAGMSTTTLKAETPKTDTPSEATTPEPSTLEAP